MPMPLNQLLPQADSSVLIREITLDSRRVLPGDLFIAVPGVLSDGRLYIAEAVQRGAAAIAYEARGFQYSLPLNGPSAVVPVPVENLGPQVSAIAGRFYGEPSRSLRMIGVTGTNGKTTVTQLTAQALDLLGEHCGIIGTLGSGFFDALKPGTQTTPDPVSIQGELAQLMAQHAEAVAMEVSSHGLEQDRVAAVCFDVVVFTNLTRDHLDYHGTLEAYQQAKAKLFFWKDLGCRVINIDDAFGCQLAAERHESRLITYSVSNPDADLYCTDVSCGEWGIRARLVSPQGGSLLTSRLVGSFNLSNLLAVIGVLQAMDYPLDESLLVLQEVVAPAGRMQCLGGVDEPMVVVDYAHTPDALEKTLEALRPFAKGKLVCVFGCGGNRDTGKRSLMATVAERMADTVVVTDDNPRDEPRELIVEHIRRGFLEPEKVQMIPERAEAIRWSIGRAGPGDVVLVAGKGHENYQEIQGVRYPFSDLIEAEKALAARRQGA